jgi:hypothetical protein
MSGRNAGSASDAGTTDADMARLRRLPGSSWPLVRASSLSAWVSYGYAAVACLAT